MLGTVAQKEHGNRRLKLVLDVIYHFFGVLFVWRVDVPSDLRDMTCAADDSIDVLSIAAGTDC